MHDWGSEPVDWEKKYHEVSETLLKIGKKRAEDKKTIAELQARVESLRKELKGQQTLSRFYKEWLIDAGMPLPEPPQEGGE